MHRQEEHELLREVFLPHLPLMEKLPSYQERIKFVRYTGTHSFLHVLFAKAVG
jgi:hypothetical protein